VTLTGKLAIIGGGRMGEAIAAGLLEAGIFPRDGIVVAEPDPDRRASRLGVGCVPSSAEAVRGADTVLLAVKPQIIDLVASEISDSLDSRSLVVSIAAGISTARLESALPAGTPVVRVMPNTPAMVREGMSVVSGGLESTPEQVASVRELFGALGRAIVLDEHFQDAATAISGSGPAYVALFVDSLARAGVRQGLTREVAQALAVQTVRGTAELLERTGQHPEQLIDAVSSPGGTTIAALEALEAGGFRSSISAAVAAAVARSRELGG
jgi:pyrroline-5-carboxylate reductase